MGTGWVSGSTGLLSVLLSVGRRWDGVGVGVLRVSKLIFSPSHHSGTGDSERMGVITKAAKLSFLSGLKKVASLNASS